MTKSFKAADISVVAPVFNEGPTLRIFVEQVVSELKRLSNYWQLILVDDGSNEATKQILRDVSFSYESVKIITFVRNFGQHAAIEAGISESVGDLTIVMDSDLQDSPQDIEKLLLEIQKGYDVVFGKRRTLNVPFQYKLSRFIFYKVLNSISGIKFDPSVGNFCIFNSRFRLALEKLHGSIPFFPSATQWIGLQKSHVDVERGVRDENSSTKYSFRGRYRLAGIAISTISTRPLRFAISVGIIIYLIAFLAGLISLLLANLKGTAISGWSSLVILTLVLSGTQLLSLGIIGVYMSHMSERVRSLPRYLTVD
jgi:dolichol-phosphate mannosyltransferase